MVVAWGCPGSRMGVLCWWVLLLVFLDLLLRVVGGVMAAVAKGEEGWRGCMNDDTNVVCMYSRTTAVKNDLAYLHDCHQIRQARIENSTTVQGVPPPFAIRRISTPSDLAQRAQDLETI